MLKLWGRTNSINVKKVLWMLDELGQPYDRVDAGMEHGRVNDADYRAMNPNGRVPTLVDGDFILWESNSVLRYLAMKYQSPLYPADPAARASADRWMDWQLTTLGPAERNARAVRVFYEADAPTGVAAHARDHDDVRLAALRGVDGDDAEVRVLEPRGAPGLLLVRLRVLLLSVEGLHLPLRARKTSGDGLIHQQRELVPVERDNADRLALIQQVLQLVVHEARDFLHLPRVAAILGVV